MKQIVIGLLGSKGAGKDTAAAHLIEQYGFRRIAFADALYREAAEAFGVTVPFLNNRDTKETPLPQMALRHCKDARFVEIVKQELCRLLVVEFNSRGLGTIASYIQLNPGFGASLQADLMEMPLSPRFVLNLWGTEYKRKVVDDAYWLNQVRSVIEANPEQHFAITDVRYPNEADAIEALPGGFLLRVLRPKVDAEEAARRLAGDKDAVHSSATALLDRATKYQVTNLEDVPGNMHQELNSVVYAEQQLLAA